MNRRFIFYNISNKFNNDLSSYLQTEIAFYEEASSTVIPANSIKEFIIPLVIPTGYKVGLVVPHFIGSPGSQIAFVSIRIITENKVEMRYVNFSSSNKTVDIPSCAVLFIKQL